MPKHEREIYHSENGDRWFLCRDEDDRTFVLHKANVSSGGKVTPIELGDFWAKAKQAPSIRRLPVWLAVWLRIRAGAMAKSMLETMARDETWPLETF